MINNFVKKSNEIGLQAISHLRINAKTGATVMAADSYATLRDEVRRGVEKSGFQQKEIAFNLGVSEAELSKMLGGSSKFDIDKLIPLLDLIGYEALENRLKYKGKMIVPLPIRKEVMLQEIKTQFLRLSGLMKELSEIIGVEPGMSEILKDSLQASFNKQTVNY